MSQPHPLHVRVGPHGRVVIPAAMRRALKLEIGDELVASLEGERSIFERRETVERRVRQCFAHIPKEVSFADELIAERREEAKREAKP
jgi:bifunctional DNA-binding transcriptional regulator/antitoxin component of YhaV-PrlF toxin-antitoxin module